MAFPQVAAPATGAARCWNPQLFPTCAQDRRYFAQVIHRLVHIRRVIVPLAGLAGGGAAQALAGRAPPDTRIQPGRVRPGRARCQRWQPTRLTGASPGQLIPSLYQTGSLTPSRSKSPCAHQPPGQDHPGPLPPASVTGRPAINDLLSAWELGRPATNRHDDPGNTISHRNSPQAKARSRADRTLQHGTGPGPAWATVGSPQLPK